MSKSKQVVTFFWKQDIQNQPNSPLGPLPSLLPWNGNKCYMEKKKKIQPYQYIRDEKNSRYQILIKMEPSAWPLSCLPEEAPCASIHWLRCSWSNGPTEIQPKSAIVMVAVPSWGLRDRVPTVPWHNTLPDTSPGWSHPCLPHSALEQGSPGCSRVFTLPCEHNPPVFIYTGRNKGKQTKKEAGTVSICSAPEHWASSMQHSWDLLLLLLCAGKSLHCKGFKLFQELVLTPHRNTKSFVPNLLQHLALKKSGMWSKALFSFIIFFIVCRLFWGIFGT